MKKLKELLVLVMQTAVLTAVTLFCAAPFSCRLTEEGIMFVGSDYTAPAIEAVEVVDERTVRMSFSEGIKISSVVVSKMEMNVSDSMEHSSTTELSPALAAAGGAGGAGGNDGSAAGGIFSAEAQVSEDGTSITFLMERDCEVGQKYEIFGVVEDKTGNTLSFCVPFTGYNSRIPEVVMTEILIKHGSNSQKTIFRNEFIELLALTPGNLAGIEIVSGSDGEKKKFVLPPVEVSAGEVVLVHLRCLGEGCVTETDDLNESSAPHSCNGIRDIWSENDGSALNDKSDVIILRKGPDGDIIDAFMYAEEGAVGWKNGPKIFAEAACAAEIYDSAEIDQAFTSRGATQLRSFQRRTAENIRTAVLNGSPVEYPVRNSSEDWELGNAGPGDVRFNGL